MTLSYLLMLINRSDRCAVSNVHEQLEGSLRTRNQLVMLIAELTLGLEGYEGNKRELDLFYSQ